MALSLLQQIQQASLKLLLPLDSTELYRTCVKEAVSLVGANYGSLFLEKNDRLVRVFTTVPISKRLVPRNNGNTYKSFLEGKIQFLYRETIKNTHPEAEKDLAAIILIPLTHQRKRIGIMTLQCLHRTKYSAELKQSLKLFGSLATLAIRNIELYEDAQAALQTRELNCSARTSYPTRIYLRIRTTCAKSTNKRTTCATKMD
jgi:transcriptional regulator with GAF, ATPase, and Fis domain